MDRTSHADNRGRGTLQRGSVRRYATNAQRPQSPLCYILDRRVWRDLVTCGGSALGYKISRLLLGKMAGFRLLTTVIGLFVGLRSDLGRFCKMEHLSARSIGILWPAAWGLGSSLLVPPLNRPQATGHSIVNPFITVSRPRSVSTLGDIQRAFSSLGQIPWPGLRRR